MGNNVSRRSFLMGSALAGVGAVAGLAGCSPQEPAQGGSETLSQTGESGAAPAAGGMTGDKYYEKWDFEIAPAGITDDQIAEIVEAEVIVVGAGTGGLVLANTAADAGADVVMITASSIPIGRGGSNHAVYSKAKERLGLPRDTAEDFERELRFNTSAVDARKWYKYYNHSEEAMNWLIDIMEAAGYETGIESPPGLVKDGAIIYCPGAHGWLTDEAHTMGGNQAFVVNTLAERLEKNTGRPIAYKTIARQLVRGDVPNGTEGRVTAVIAEREDGSYVKYVGSKAIVLATGDFSGNKDMVAKYAPQAYQFIDPALFEEEQRDYDKEFVYGGIYYGDGQQMGLWVGAAWQKAWVCGLNGGGAKPGMPPLGGGMLLPCLVVGNDGRRYMNEYASLGTGPCTHFASAPNHENYAIWNASYAEKYPLTWVDAATPYGEDGWQLTPEQVVGGWEMFAENGIIKKADTIEELIDAFGLPKEETLATIERYNKMCAAGEDTEFHKDPSLMIPVDEGPFYGVFGDSNFFLTTLGGLRTGENMEVCDEHDVPIPGLYNVGSMVGDMFGGYYTAYTPGLTYGSSITLSYLAGKHIAENE